MNEEKRTEQPKEVSWSVIAVEGNQLMGKEEAEALLEGIEGENVFLQIKGEVKIGEDAFQGCDLIKKVEIGAGVSVIGEGAFSWCASLMEFFVDEENPSFKAIDGNLYTKDGERLIQYALGKNEKELTLPQGVKIIGRSALSSSKNLESVTLPISVAHIEDSAFSCCEALSCIELSEGLETIGRYAFCGCERLNNVKLPHSLYQIGELAFVKCKALKDVTVQTDNIQMGYGAFESAVQIKRDAQKINRKKKLNDAPVDWAEDEQESTPKKAWSSVQSKLNTIKNNKKALIISLCSVAVAIIMLVCVGLIYFNPFVSFDIENTDGICYVKIDGIGALKAHHIEELYDMPRVSSAKSVEIEICDGIKSIGTGAFAYRANITKVTISDSVKSIGDEAFTDCYSIKTFKMGGGVSKIGDYAFNDCDSLSNIELLSSVTKIGKGAFSDCDNLGLAIVGASVSVIGDNAFAIGRAHV